MGAPAFSPSATSSSFPTSEIAPSPTEEAFQTIIEEFDLTDEQAVELRKDPQAWIRANILKQNGLVEVKPRSKRRSRKSADDG